MIKRKRKLNKAAIVNRPPGMYVKSDVVNRTYLTKGKLYKTIPPAYKWESNNLQTIRCDDGDQITILINGCAFLDGGSWDVVWM